jgi:hypothetical protein
MAGEQTPRRLVLLWLGVIAMGHPRAAPAKLAPAAVKYIAVSAVAGKACIECSQFVVGATARALGSCKIVEGDIDPRGHCIAFSAKPKP